MVAALAVAATATVVTADESGRRSPIAASVVGALDPTAPTTGAAVSSLAPRAPEPPLYIGDAALRGVIDPGRAKLVDGRYLVDLGGGRQAVLTLEPALQEAAEAVLDRARVPFGGVVVMGVDGRLLALAGRRAEDETTPVRDARAALEVWAPAASVFKIVTGAALVEAGVRPSTEVCYHGGLRSVERSNLVDNPRRDRACADLTAGVARSQNAIIGKLAHRHLDPAGLRQTARAFEFDQIPAFALDAEPGRFDIPDTDLEFARVAAGFWHTELSPLGGALVANVIASGGLAVTPRLVEAVIEPDGTESIVHTPEPRRAIEPHVASDVARMMTATVTTGTARRGFYDSRGRRFFGTMDVAGKTGTLTRQSPSYLQYSWFVGFAPADEPQVTISVLLGNPPLWHLRGHTAARIVLESAL